MKILLKTTYMKKNKKQESNDTAKLANSIATEYEDIEIKDGVSIADVVKEIETEMELPHRILLARVNGIDTELSETLSEGDRLELLDMRTQSANITYQRSLTMIFLTALRDVEEAKGKHDVRGSIDFSLNKGLFTQIVVPESVQVEAAKGEVCELRYKLIDVSEETIAEVEARMRELVEADIPIEAFEVSKEEGIEKWEEFGYPEKATLLRRLPDGYRAKFYRIGDFENYFFGPMVPSTGYIEHFELRKYMEGLVIRFPDPAKPDELPPYRDDNKLYEAFTDERKWLDLLDAKFLPDLNNIISEGKIRDTILFSEALHEKRIAEIADMIKEQGKRIILIAGPSSSGKTTFARRLCIQLRVNGLDPLYMGTDDYFIDREFTPLDENGEPNYENLEALDLDLFSENMNDLLAGKEVDLPVFDFISGKKIFGQNLMKIERSQPIVIEGIHALNGKMTEQIADKEKFRVYISPFVQLNIDLQNRVPTTDARMLRRMIRDYQYRGHDASATIAHWPKVRAGEEKNIFPYNAEADVVFNSSLAYETCLLKRRAVEVLGQVKPDADEYGEAQRLLSLLEFFEEIDEDRYVPTNSILREFIGGSVFVEE